MRGNISRVRHVYESKLQKINFNQCNKLRRTFAEFHGKHFLILSNTFLVYITHFVYLILQKKKGRGKFVGCGP